MFLFYFMVASLIFITGLILGGVMALSKVDASESEAWEMGFEQGRASARKCPACRELQAHIDLHV